MGICCWFFEYWRAVYGRGYRDFLFGWVGVTKDKWSESRWRSVRVDQRKNVLNDSFVSPPLASSNSINKHNSQTFFLFFFSFLEWHQGICLELIRGLLDFPSCRILDRVCSLWEEAFGKMMRNRLKLLVGEERLESCTFILFYFYFYNDFFSLSFIQLNWIQTSLILSVFEINNST